MSSLKPLEEQEKRNIRGLLLRNTTELPNGCLEWTAGSGVGYPILWTGKRQIMGHRAVIAMYEELLPGNVVRHLCHNKKCLNIAHLKQGTHKENGEDESLKYYKENLHLYKEAKVLVVNGSNVAMACREVGLPYTSTSRRVINEIIS